MSEPKTTKYRVRDGFTLHPVPEGDPLEGGTELDLTDEEAAFYAAQIELADPVKIKAALAEEAKIAKAVAAANAD